LLNKSQLFIAVLAGGFFAQADCLPGAQGVDRVLVHYRPGPIWNQIDKVMGCHLQFIKDQTAAHEVKSGGPVYAKDGSFVGGMIIFNSNSISHVESLLANDPDLSTKTAVYEIETWGECTMNTESK
jgi:uncharacterized protein YciI